MITTSVTKVLDAYTEPFLIEWKLKMGKVKSEAISKEALVIGTEVDALIRLDVTGQKWECDKSVQAVKNCMLAWENFKQANPSYMQGVEGIQTELTSGDLVGHPDIYHLTGIDDIKTGNSLTLRSKYCVQASKYALMAGKTRAGIILLSKTNETGRYLYVWWDGELLTYFGQTVFDAFKTIYEYNDVADEMVRRFLEREILNVS